MPDTESIVDRLRQKLTEMPTGILASALMILLATIAALLIWAEAESKWDLAQACALALLLLVALIGLCLVRPVDEKQLTKDAKTYERAKHRVLIGVVIGYSALAINATRADRWECGLAAKAFGYGTLIAGACLIAGVLLGFLFGFRPVGAKQDLPKPSDEDCVHPYTNLEEIADWLTKLILGATLVEVRQLVKAIGHFAEYVSQGLYPIADNCKAKEQPNPAVSLAVISFFFLCGVLYGYLWTRFEFALESRRHLLTNRTLHQPAALTQSSSNLPSSLPGPAKD